ncbi:DUF4173 domain-containing protein [bacterium 1XD8-76]|nr:DUF4173 domain-containing protein [bacterium 1XD8-76]
MENNTVIAAAGTSVSGVDNLYPNELYKVPEEVRKKSSSAKPELAEKVAPACFLYAVFFTFCLYRNASGIAFPFYVAGTIGFAVYTIRRSGISWRGEHIGAVTAGLLFGISNCFTDDSRIILMNEAWLFVLMTYFLLSVYFDTRRWQFRKFLGNILGLTFGSIGRMFSFFPDAQAWMEKHRGTKNSQACYVLAGVGASIPLIAIVLILLSSADVIFRESVHVVFGDIDGWDVFCCIFWSSVMFFFSYGMVSLLDSRGLNEEVKDHRKGQPIIAISATAVIALIYVYFCVIQVVYLFAGYGTLPEGYTYAQYARQGFFQLLFICLMNLALVLTGLGFFRESRVLKGILLVISLCTFIMTASSAYRMLLYIGAYYLTFLRIFVLWALAVIALLLAGIVGKTLKNRFPLFRYGLCVITVCYLVLSYSRPDYWIARYNISACLEQRAEDTEMGRELDIRYLSGLSADAAPVIMPLNGKMERTEDDWYNYYITRHAERAEEMSLRSYNFSRGYVKRMLAGGQGYN